MFRKSKSIPKAADNITERYETQDILARWKNTSLTISIDSIGASDFFRLGLSTRCVNGWSANPTYMMSKLRSSIQSFRVPRTDKIPPGADLAQRTTSRNKTPHPTDLAKGRSPIRFEGREYRHHLT